MSSRPSVELQIEQGKSLQDARALQARFDNTDLELVKRVAELNRHNLDEDGDSDDEEGENKAPKDPAIIALDVAAQIAFLRKLKFQYLEKNAKDKYVKSIVSDIDDAPIVTQEDNDELSSVNAEKKEKLKAAKGKLAEVHGNIRLLAPMVEQDYQRVKQATERATLLSQKIIQARTSLLLLRQTHPQPRLTIPLADQKLVDQVDQMQSLSDQVQATKQKAKGEKDSIKSLTSEVENLRLESAEVNKAVKLAQVEEDDSRLVPLYDWYTASLALHRSISNLEEFHSESENELRLSYKLDGTTHHIIIILIFAPDTRQLAAVQTDGLEELGVEAGELIDAHIQANDVHGLIAAILSRARAAVAAL